MVNKDIVTFIEEEFLIYDCDILLTVNARETLRFILRTDRTISCLVFHKQIYEVSVSKPSGTADCWADKC